MRGITVVGTGLDSGEALVAAAACGAAQNSGHEAALFVTVFLGPDAESAASLAESFERQAAHALRTQASPAIAASHAGAALDPALLTTQARNAAAHDDMILVAAAPGGIMAPVTERYSNRDFARELGLPVVIAARAQGGVTGDVRAAAEAARAAGLPIAAVVLTGWPDPPNRIQLDERKLLDAIARAEVLTLPDGARNASELADAASGWPVAEWAKAAQRGLPEAERVPPELATSAPSGAPAASAAAEPLVLDPYDAWAPHQVGDPRNTRRPQIMNVMLEIIGQEGPMTASRAYSLYNRAAGGRKLTSVAKAPLSSAVYWLAREEKVTLTRESDIPWQGDDMVRLPDQPAVRVREIGPRQLDEVPLDEIAELVKLIRRGGGSSDPTELKRAILGAYGLVRLTARADEYLGLAIDLAS